MSENQLANLIQDLSRNVAELRKEVQGMAATLHSVNEAQNRISLGSETMLTCMEE